MVELQPSVTSTPAGFLVATGLRGPSLTIAPVLGNANALVPVGNPVSNALTARAVEQLRGVDVDAALAVARANARFERSAGMMTAHVVALPAVVFGGMSAIQLAFIAPAALITGVCNFFSPDFETARAAAEYALVSGKCLAAAAGCSAALFLPPFMSSLRASKRARGELEQGQSATVPAIVRVAKGTTGVERAWLALRAERTLETLGAAVARGSELALAEPRPSMVRRFLAKLNRPALQIDKPLASSSLVPGLREAANRDGLGEAELATALAMNRAFELVFDTGDVGSHIRLKEAQPELLGVRSDVVTKMPALLHALEGLSPEARLLLAPSIRDSVLVRLGPQPENAYLVRRFLEALDGNRTPYAGGEGVLEIPAPQFTLAALKTQQESASTPAAKATREIAAATRAQAELAQSIDARAVLADTASAEAVAAHFEASGFRAVIHGSAKGFEVVVYDADHPPSL